MQYTIYPCTEFRLERIMKEIRTIIKKTEMKITFVDMIIKTQASAEDPAIYDTIIVIEHIPKKKKYGFGL